MNKGMELILEERRREVEVLGFDAGNDAKYERRELLWAAKAYEAAASEELQSGKPYQGLPPAGWPWAHDWFKPAGGAVRMLVKAGALYLAEEARYEAELAKDGTYAEGSPNRDVLRVAEIIERVYAKQIGVHLLGELVLVKYGGRIREVRVTQLSPERGYVKLAEIKGTEVKDACWLEVTAVELLEVLTPPPGNGEEGAA